MNKTLFSNQKMAKHLFQTRMGQADYKNVQGVKYIGNPSLVKTEKRHNSVAVRPSVKTANGG